MRLLEAYTQYSKPVGRSTNTRKYENAALLKRQGRVFKVPPEPIKPNNPLRTEESFQVYKRPLYQHEVKLEEKPVTPEQKEIFTQKQMQEAIQAYRKSAGFTFAFAADFGVMIRGIATGQIKRVDAGAYDEAITSERKKREEDLKTRNQELWNEFDVQHMLYIDDEKIFSLVKNTASGQIINVAI